MPVPWGIFHWCHLCWVLLHTLTVPCLLGFVASISSRNSFFYVWPFHQTLNFIKERLSLGFPSSSGVKNLPAMWETLGWEDPLEEAMATHSSILAWRVPWTEEPGSLQSTVHRVTELDTTEAIECTHTHKTKSVYIAYWHIVGAQ